MTIVALKKSVSSRIAHVAVCLRSRQGQTHPLVQGSVRFFRSHKVNRPVIGTFDPEVRLIIWGNLVIYYTYETASIWWGNLTFDWDSEVRWKASKLWWCYFLTVLQFLTNNLKTVLNSVMKKQATEKQQKKSLWPCQLHLIKMECPTVSGINIQNYIMTKITEEKSYHAHEKSNREKNAPCRWNAPPGPARLPSWLRPTALQTLSSSEIREFLSLSALSRYI